MKIAIGLMLIIFGVLLALVGAITDAKNEVLFNLRKEGMMASGPFFYTPLFIISAVIIIVGCVVYQRGIKE